MGVYIIMDLTDIGWGGVDLINPNSDRNKCVCVWGGRALVNEVINFRVPMQRIAETDEKELTCPEGGASWSYFVRQTDRQ